MAASNFKPLAQQLLKIEGGVADRPLSEDPGGLTNKGVTQVVYDRWRTLKGLPTRTVRKITVGEALEIAKTEYWDTVRGDDLPSGVDFAVFDFAFNSGPVQAVKDLQRVLGAKVDGSVGAETLTLLSQTSQAKVIGGLCDRRLAFMRKLKNWNANKNGWTARVAHVRAQSLALAAGEKPDAPDVTLTSMPIAKAPPPAPVPAKKSPTVWAAITVAVGGFFKWLTDLLLQIPEFAHSALSAINPFTDKSPVAAAIANGIGGLAAVAGVYVAWSVIQKNREHRS